MTFGPVGRWMPKVPAEVVGASCSRYGEGIGPTTPELDRRLHLGHCGRCLRDLYVRGKYRDVILPMTVLRRLDAVLEPTKQAVLDMRPT